MAHRTASQVANRRRVEALIRLAAPALDLVLYAGEKVSKVAGRNELSRVTSSEGRAREAGGRNRLLGLGRH